MDHYPKKLTPYQIKMIELSKELAELTKTWNPIDLLRSREDRNWRAYDRLSDMDQLRHRLNEAKLYLRGKS